jgi:hypothetical protein
MGKSVVREGSSERKIARRNASQIIAQKIADVAERMLERGEDIESRAGRFITVYEGNEPLSVVFTLKISRKS